LFDNKRTKRLLKNINKTIYKYGLIEDGDKIAVSISGGKDSFTLLHLLNIRRTVVNENYQIYPVNVAFDGKKNPSLASLVKKEEMDLVYLPLSSDELINKNKGKIDCFRCSWMRRRLLFEWATKNGVNKLAFGHHMNDSNETVLLNLFFHGNLEPLDVKAEFFEGKLTVIRPMIYIKESEIKRYVKNIKDAFSKCSCEYVDNTKREQMKNIIKEIRKNTRNVDKNIWQASKLWEKYIKK